MIPEPVEELGADEEAPSYGELASLSSAPPPSDVHNASTMVAELPPSFLESLKSQTALVPLMVLAPRVTPLPRVTPPPRARMSEPGLVDLVDLSDEPETLQLELETMLFERRLSTLPPLEAEPPRTIELHVLAPSDALGAVDSAIAQLPRPWMIAGALVAAVMTASVAFGLLWTIVRLF